MVKPRNITPDPHALMHARTKDLPALTTTLIRAKVVFRAEVGLEFFVVHIKLILLTCLLAKMASFVFSVHVNRQLIR